MITIARRQARRLRAVFRRHVLGVVHRAPIPPLVFRADPGQLRVRHRYGALAVEVAEPHEGPAHEAVALPIDALAEFEGCDDALVVMEAAGPDRTCACWNDGGFPQVREYAVPALDSLTPFPEPPDSWTDAPPELLGALAEASATTSETSTRYALNCLQLRGEDGEVAATDGHQLLIQGGFRLPWEESLLVRRSPIFACRALPRDRPLRIGRTGSHVVLENGPWTLYLEVQAEGRFPVLGDVVHHPDAAATRLRLDPDDARFLAGALGRLPGGDGPNAPATLDLNGVVAVRAGGDDPAGVTELVLSRSSCAGTPTRLSTNRELLARAIRLGFDEVEIVDAVSPLVCRDARRRFAWQPLAAESAIAPSDDVTRIESDPRTTPAAIPLGAPQKVRTAVSERSKNLGDTAPASNHNGANGHATPEGQGPTGLAALIREAEALHEALTDTRARAVRLVAALRRHRKQARLMSSTIAALKQIRLQEVGE